MAARLRALIARPGCHLMPCCFDGLSAKLVEQAGFPVTFVSGFSASAAQHALPDVGLLSYGEMVEMMRRTTGALARTPVIGDGDTGYGNAVNVKRTVAGYARAGLAGVMIEDQVAPKRCGHTRDKAVVDRATAVMRIQAAVDASRELVASAGSHDDAILIVARTDALKTHGLDEALSRAAAFRDAGVSAARRSRAARAPLARRSRAVRTLARALIRSAVPLVRRPISSSSRRRSPSPRCEPSATRWAECRWRTCSRAA
jgi:2-methylisocitrate lyase-like PEP mutase family enzyme